MEEHSRIRCAVLALTAAACLAGGAAADAPRDAGVEEIQACAARNLPGGSGSIGFAVEVEDRAGDVTTSRARLLWRRDGDGHQRVLIRVSEPAKIAGTSMLMVEKPEGEPELFVHLPELSRVKRVRGRRLRGPLLGTDFSYEDLDRLRRPISTEGLRLIGSQQVDGSPAWALEFIPEDDRREEYQRVVTYVEQEHCLPIRIEFFGEENRLHKVLTTPRSGIRPHGRFLLPHHFVMRDVSNGTETRVHVDRVQVPAQLSDAHFTRNALLDPPPAAPSP